MKKEFQFIARLAEGGAGPEEVARVGEDSAVVEALRIGVRHREGVKKEDGVEVVGGG